MTSLRQDPIDCEDQAIGLDLAYHIKIGAMQEADRLLRVIEAEFDPMAVTQVLAYHLALIATPAQLLQALEIHTHQALMGPAMKDMPT